ncbi:MAG: RNA polymerase sigma factor [Deferribacteres bacterium]|nr:RNA polymerase sigma factor [candidate division KSB1 bacterium]MCB9502060.1 RNA polymerase sigma factor [Deferribacteres bacterium]
MQEDRLLKLLRNGDEQAFKQVFDQNQKHVINICYRFVGQKEIAEDLTQDVFVEVFRSIDRFRGNSKLSTWIYRIATTRSIDYLRAQKSKKRFAFLTSIEDSEICDKKLPDSVDINPDKNAQNEEIKKILHKALKTLPENQRIAFTLSKYDELSYKEIADILETSLPAVESLIHRAKKNLEKKLYKYFKN